MAQFRTHYDNLGVARNAESAVIKAAYKALAQKYHPDRNSDNPNAEKIMQIINKAYQVLSDPVTRAEHDRWIDEQEAIELANSRSQEIDDFIYKYNLLKSMEKAQQASSKSKAVDFSTVIINNALKVISKFFLKLKVVLKWLFKIVIVGALAFLPFFIIVKWIGSSPSVDESVATTEKNTYEAQKGIMEGVSDFTDIKAEDQDESLGVDLQQAEADYNEAVANINSIWNSLHPNTKDYLRSEQREINMQREADCIAYGNSQSSNRNLAKAHRYLCEVPKLNERAEFLKTQLDTMHLDAAYDTGRELPNTGFTNNPSMEGVAPLQIKTSSGSHYWVKIAYLDGSELASFFIRGGDTLDVEVPEGSYEIKYASGDTWYGEQSLFGEETQYAKADSVFNFTSDGYSYDGYVIELIRQVNGNLSTSHIDANQF